ncbi:MAG: molybdopterin oxidoreductase family protein, partial [Xanthobacteraceae bacterium]
AGQGEPNPDQLNRYIANGSYWRHELPDEQKYYKMANRAYLDFALGMGFISSPEPITFQLYCEPLQRFRLAAQGRGPILPPPSERERLLRFFDPLPIWYAPLSDQQGDVEAYGLHAITQRPMHMYHSWGSQNAWLRQITNQNRLFVHRSTAARLGIADDDWVWIESPQARVKGQVRLVDGVNPNTVWTWNAIAKHRGAWMLSPDAPEFERAFLLNHAISELLPPDRDGTRRSNSDPVTGQAAWFDLRVRIRPCAPSERGFSEPQFAAFASPPGLTPPRHELSYGRQFRLGPEARP